MMKLLVIGAGVVGRDIATTSAQLGRFGAITVADRDFNAAKAAVQTCNGTAVQLDATDRQATAALMRGADVVISAIGPASRFSVTMLEAAISARCPVFTDISDDPQPTLDMLAMDARAKAAGITAVIGLGASPGINNMLAVAAGQKLTRVDRILTGWGSGGIDDDDDVLPDNPTAAFEHWIDQCSGTIPTLEQGRIVQTKPLTPICVDYPGIGKVTAYTVGHPEPVTLSRRFPELQNSSSVMDFQSYLIAALREAGQVVNNGGTLHQGAARLVELLRQNSDDSFWSRKALMYGWNALKDITKTRWLPPFWALAEGEKDGKPQRIGVALNGQLRGGLGPITAIPAAVAVAILADTACRPGPGVVPIEMAIKPDAFFARLAPFMSNCSTRSPVSALQFSTAPHS